MIKCPSCKANQEPGVRKCPKCKRDSVAVLFEKYQKKEKRWEFLNGILYDMCSENPEHNNIDIIAGKVILIGRSYAAALERGRGTPGTVDDFYYDKVAHVMKNQAIDSINDPSKNIDKIAEVLKTHRMLVDMFAEIIDGNNPNRRSFASKYLHFHCPRFVYLYDNNAKSAASKIVQYPNKTPLNNLTINEYDEQYGEFVCRILELKAYLRCNPSPREIDEFLLWIYDDYVRT